MTKKQDLEEIELQMQEVTLKIMSTTLVKHSEEHMTLRAELHRLNDIKKELSVGIVPKNKVDLQDADLQKAMAKNKAEKAAKLRAKGK